MSPLTSQTEVKMKDFICKFVYCCKPIHDVANLLDPRFKGNNVSDDSGVTAFDWVTKQATHLRLDVEKILSNFAKYGSSLGI